MCLRSIHFAPRVPCQESLQIKAYMGTWQRKANPNGLQSWAVRARASMRIFREVARMRLPDCLSVSLYIHTYIYIYIHVCDIDWLSVCMYTCWCVCVNELVCVCTT